MVLVKMRKILWLIFYLISIVVSLGIMYEPAGTYPITVTDSASVDKTTGPNLIVKDRVVNNANCSECHGTVYFTASQTYAVNENELQAVINIMRTDGLDQCDTHNPPCESILPLRVTLKTVPESGPGKATEGLDYPFGFSVDVELPEAGPPGATITVTTAIPITNDNTVEGNETVKLELSNPMVWNATLRRWVSINFKAQVDPKPIITIPDAVLTIQDDDVAPVGTLQFSANTYNVNEGGGSAAITTTRTGGSNGLVSVTFQTVAGGSATAGSDYTPVTQTVTFADGDTANKTVLIPIANDNVVEGNETVNVALVTATGGATLGSPNTAVLTLLDDVSFDNTAFVRQQFLDFLDREPDPGGLAFWVGSMDAGLPASSLIESFMDSEEFLYKGKFIAQAYVGILLRDADYDGFRGWLALLGGMSREQIVQAFLDSSEFQARFGSNLTNSQFVQNVYETILLRPPDSAGFDHWRGRLNAGQLTRAQVALSFLDSVEFQALTESQNQVNVSILYFDMLRRQPDPGGFDFWLSALDSGVPLTSVIDAFLNSAEYQLRF